MFITLLMVCRVPPVMRRLSNTEDGYSSDPGITHDVSIAHSQPHQQCIHYFMYCTCNSICMHVYAHTTHIHV